MENPLALLDGVPVFNSNRLMAFAPLKVRELDVITNHYFLGPVRHNGLVSFRTYRGDLAGFSLDAQALLLGVRGRAGPARVLRPALRHARRPAKPPGRRVAPATPLR